jgi:hypothetical protein
MDTVSATELARNTRDLLDKVTNNGETIGISRNNALIARLSPPVRSKTATQVLSDIKLPAWSPAQANEWLTDSKHDFETAWQTHGSDLGQLPVGCAGWRPIDPRSAGHGLR